MKRLLLVGLVVMAANISASASAQNAVGFMTGNEILDACKDAPTLVVGYVEGIIDADLFAKHGYCLPDKVRISQLRDIACRYLDTNPGTRHHQASSLVRSALKESFPCQ